MSKKRGRAWRRAQRERIIQKRMDRYPTERRLPGKARLWQCHMPDGTPINMFHREYSLGPLVREEPDGSLVYEYQVPVGATGGFPTSGEDKVVEVRWHQYGCPERGTYTEWVKRPDGEWGKETRGPTQETCECTSRHPHWGDPVPPAGYFWRVIKEYTPEDRGFAEGKLDKTALPAGAAGDQDHWKPSGKDKRWKMMYTRKEKLHRAKKLGFDYDFHRQRHWRDWSDEGLE